MNVSKQTVRAVATTTPGTALARVGLGVLAAVALLAASAAQAQTISTGPASTGEPAANTTVAPGSPKVLLDAFTMTASTGTAPVTSVTVVLTTGAAALVERITIEDSQYCAMPTPYGTALNPASDTVVVSTSGLSVATGAARPYWVCLKPKSAAAMAAVPGSSLAVTGRVSAATATGYTAGTNTDTVAAGARVIDNASPAAVTAVSGVAGDHQVGLRWTNPADADFKEVVILQNTAAITDVPVEGVAYEPFTFNSGVGTYQPTLIGTSRVAYVGNATTQAIGGGSDPATWLTNGTAYYFKIFARDASGNYSAAGVQVGPFTPAASSATTIGAGSESAASTRAPGGAIADLDAFTLITSTGTDTVTALTVSLLPAKAFTVVQTVTITSNDGLTTYGTATPTSNTVSFSGLSIPVTTGLTQYRVRITPKSHAAMPAVPGASYGVTGLVTSFTCTKAKAGADSGSSTVTIDNLSPNDVVLGAVTPGNAQVALNWTNPTGDFSRVLVLRSGAPVTAYPVEGDVAATPALVGTATQVFQGAATTTTNTGLTNGQPYYYKIFTQDTSGNWSAGVGVGPLIPGAGGAASGSTVPNTLLPVVQVLNPSPGAKLATTFKVQVRAWSPAADITAVTVRVNGASPTGLTKNAKYGGGTTSGVWETVGPAHLTLAAGTYTLDAQATSSVGTVTSNSLQVTVSATKGDGNLLVRDNATQLCADCHALPTHSSEVTGSTYGSWSTACRDCHVPHGTKNVFLVGETITPPPRGAGTTAAKTVAFSNTTGVVGNMTARTSATYVNSDNTGPCQVCHTLTNYYRADGTSPGGAGHQTGQRCTNCHQHQTGMAVNCTGCHGDPARTVGVGVTGTDARLQAAPPRDTTGATVVTSRGVGAHQAHVNQNTFRTNALSCADCHPAANAHQGTVDLAWSPLANGTTASVALTPSFNGTTCASTWCHSAGGTYGGTILSPSWTGGPSQVSCSSCHGAPPPAPHPANPACGSCHAGYSTSTGINATAKLTHIDGTIQVPGGGGCTACHGTAGRTPVAGLAGTDPNIAVAPPMSTSGATTADAHLAHVNKRSVPVLCTDCHGTLPVVGDPSHPSGTVDVSMLGSALANQNGGFAAYTVADKSCSTVYCHGATLPSTAKGTNTLPKWTDTVTCGSCHGSPPGDAIHKSVAGLTACIKCHDRTVDSSGGIVINAGLHVNGVVETNVMDFGCASCHGDATRTNNGFAPATFFEGAPPTTIPGSPGAGVHLAHVYGTRSKNVECEECHQGSTAFEAFSPNPQSMWLHADGVVDLAFGPLAAQGGAVPAYTVGTGGSCAATYCHGNFSGGAGASNVTPTWLTSGQLACTACHGNPPALPHPQNDGCTSCHGANYTKTGNTTGTVNQVSHVDGTTTGQTFGCTSCHGVVNTAAPGATTANPTLAAPGVSGGLAPTTSAAPSVSVPQYGLHAAHLTQNNFTAEPIACGSCHLVPADGNTVHGSGTGGTGGATATVTFSALAYGNVAAKVTPVTTASLKGGATAGATAAAAAPGTGGAGTSAWSPLANPQYARATGCATVYCHGEFKNGQTGKTTISWTTDVTLNCNSCHGTVGAPMPATPPPTGHPASTTCGSCHNGYTGTSVNLAVHLNGKLEVSGGTACSDCHGDAARTAMVSGTFGPAQLANNLLGMPPKATSGATTGFLVGAHQSHSVPTTPNQQVFRPVQCSECHGIAVNTYPLGHSDGTAQLTFASSAIAGASNVAASITKNTPASPDTCVTYCHGGSLTAAQKGAITVWQWNSTASATCGSCHGAAPADPVHTSVSKSAPATACNPCHNTVVNTSGNIIFTGTGTGATTLHINGSRQATTTCTSCHGGTNNAPPRATSGATATTVAKVGAHQKHVTGTTLRSVALGCVECHASVPAAQNHASGTVEMGYSTLAKTFSVTPSPADLGGTAQTTWEATPSCTNYCHGAKWAADANYRGNTTSPLWTGTSADADCGDCHRSPPATSGHGTVTSTTSCGTCHTGYTCTPATLATCTVNKTAHMNGQLDANLTCASCHGLNSRTAMVSGTFGPAQSANNLLAVPPNDSKGASTGVLVGGHLSHAVPQTPNQQVFKSILCSECHGIAVNSYTTSHPNGTSNVTFASATTANLANVAAAVTQNTPPTADTCVTYCHGGSLTAAQKGSVTVWQWNTSVNATCGSCHGAAPNDPVHTSVSKSAPATACNPCHNTVVNTSGNIIFTGTGTGATTLHINGSRQNTAACNSCHGGAVNAAPPLATAGATTITNAKVGAHQRHVTATNLRSAALGCGDCHSVPVSMAHATGTVDMTYGTLATASAVSPAPGSMSGATQTTWEATPTCTNYCHGGKWAADAVYRGNTTSPTWTSSGVATQCDDCHRAPPNNGNHASVLGSTTKNCGDCHSGYSCTTGNLAACTVNKTVHLNGTFDGATLSCTSCHGSGSNAAPPLATTGATATTVAKVGAHQRHLTGSSLRATALACNNCHTVPGSTTHSNGTVDLTWNTLPSAASVSPTPSSLSGSAQTTWEATPTCTNYCHGGKWAANANYRGNTTSPNWATSGVATQCDDCHRAPPNSASHASVGSTKNCGDCHTGYNCTSGNLAACSVNKTIHLNGTFETPSMACSACHGLASRTSMVSGTFGPAQSANNLLAVPPNDSKGASTGVLVGGHLSHAVPQTPNQQVFKSILCSECHGIAVNTYTSAHPNSVADVTFASATTAGLGNVAAAITKNVAPTADTCVTYCHGGSLTAAQKGAITVWQWNTSVAADCGSCHGSPPADAVHTSVTKPSAATACNPCHNTVVNSSGNIMFTGTGTAATTLHINGSRQATTSCTSCHGGTNNAPPKATAGASTTTNPKVGAHQTHVTATRLRSVALGCVECHASVPAVQNHASGTVEMGYSTLAATASVTPSPGNMSGTALTTWEATPTCTNYCHGGKWAANASYRGNTTSPSWIGTSADADCGDCHRSPPASSGHSTVTSTTDCGSCHTGYTCTPATLATCTVNKAVHMNGSLQVNASCTGCHAGSVTGTGAGFSITRRPIVPEFGYAWSHKRSASPAGTVSPSDCGVCHMEGDTSGNMNGTYHANGLVNLRDPDTGAHIKQVTFVSTGASSGNGSGYGYYDTSSAVDATFYTFARNLSSNALEATVQAIMVNQCLKCHDSNGAASASARIGTVAARPFNTTIAGANYTGTGVTAAGTAGGVTDVNASFATSNAAYHPIRGRQNNSYVTATRMYAPWNTVTKTAGNTTSWGYILSCWDCHAPQGAIGLQTMTVTAHGGTTTLRRAYWNANATNLCTACHNVSSGSTTHGTGSAWATNGNSTPGGIAKTSCYRCHGSSNADARPTRPYSAQDVHGVNGFAPYAGTTDTLWPVGTTNTWRPYAFFRSAGGSGLWNGGSASWKPLSGPSVPTGGATCSAQANGANVTVDTALGTSCSAKIHGTYTPGGVY